MKTLFINACVRKDSRTLVLAESLLKGAAGEIFEVNLEKENISPLNRELLAERDRLIQAEKWDDPMFRYARQFAEADEIFIAAPFWDLSFPALLKIYLEAITVTGITFCYVHGKPKGLCKAKRLVYVTTSGGHISADFGYSYVKALAENFYGIRDNTSFRAENLDVDGITVDTVLNDANVSMVK